MRIYRISINGNVYKVTVPNPNERPVRAIVNGETIEVYVENDTPSASSTGSVGSQAISNVISEVAVPQHITSQSTPRPTGSTGDVKSPLPGIIVSISVKEGDRVESGQELCVLEAMKMNNPIRSTISGRVSQIHISIGQQVQHGVPLMTIEE